MEIKIFEVVSNYIPLVRKGNEYIGNCPFHEDIKGTFIVNPKMDLFKCKDCGKCGNVLNFLQHIHTAKFIPVNKYKNQLDLVLKHIEEHDTAK